MEGGFEKGFAPSKSTASSKFPSIGSAENNENDSGQYQMSPTVSAASKVAAPKKKILGERNDNSIISDAENHETINHDVKKDLQNSINGQLELERASSCIVSSYNYTSEPADKEDTIFSDDAFSKGYDPLTNCLSPRPKYLRFNPNRRSEILNRLEIEGIGLDRSVDSEELSEEQMLSVDEVENSSFPSPNGSVVNLKTDENAEQVNELISDEHDEEDELEEEEEPKRKRGWCLGGVLKHLLMLSACLFTMSYICPVNTPSPSPTQQAPLNSTDGYLMIQKQTLEVMSTTMYDAGFLGMEVGEDYEVAVEVAIDPGYDDRDSEEMVEVNEEILEGHDEQSVGDDNEDSEDKTDDDGNETQGLKEGEFEFKDENFEQLIGTKADENGDVDNLCLEKVIEYIAAKVDTVGEIESDEAKNKYVAGVYGVENEEDSNQLKEFLLPVKSKDDGSLSEELKQNDGSELWEELELPELSEKLTADSVIEFGETEYDNTVEMQKLGWSISAAFGVFVGSLSLAALAFIYSSKKAKGNAKKSKPVVKKKPQKIEDQDQVVHPSMERKVEFLARPSLPTVANEAPRELSHRIHAPTVELIGEIIVGERSHRNGGTAKFHMTEFKDQNNTTYFLNQGSLAQPVLTPIQASVIEYSSHGKFINIEKKTLKKEKGQSGEDAVIQAAVATPLRRSSRLRNRPAAISP